MVIYVTMKNWLKQIRDGIGGDKEEKDDKGEDISSLYEIIEDFLKALDHEQVKGIRDEFLDRYEFHREVVGDVIKPRKKKKESAEPSGEGAVLGLDSEKIDEVRELSEIRFRALEDKIETRSKLLEERLGGIEKEVSEKSAHHLELIRLLQRAVHEQNRRIFYFFNRAWLLILSIVVSILIGGAAIILIFLK
jgi:hypothetical protein